MKPGDQPRHQPDLIVRAVEDETVVWDRRGQRIHHLNRTATFIWERCDGRRSVEQIAHQMARAFSREPTAVQADVAATMALFVDAGLLEIDSGGPDDPMDHG